MSQVVLGHKHPKLRGDDGSEEDRHVNASENSSDWTPSLPTSHVIPFSLNCELLSRGVWGLRLVRWMRVKEEGGP